MREILFRGKRKDNGEWVEGYYAKATYYLDESAGSKKDIHIIFPTDLTAYPRCEFSGYEEVIPETVGQFTGLLDKNGKKIFEGDITEYKGFIKRDYYEIRFGEASFVHRDIVRQEIGGTPFDDIEYGMDSSWMEVIGNIHDNPELLEVRP